MRKSALVLSCWPALVAAQQTFVVPSKANTTPPGVTYLDASPQGWPFYGSTSVNRACRILYLYDVADIPIPAAVLTSLAVRPLANGPVPAGTYQTRITLSMGPNASSAVSATFASNHGPTSAVFNGAVNIVPSAGRPWPAPWQPPIMFAQPFVYAFGLGNALVVEFDTTSSSTNTSWFVEGYRAELGNAYVELFQSNCRNSGRFTGNSYSFDALGLRPGGSLSFTLGTYPINTPSLANNVLFIAQGGLNSSVGPFVTPFDLSLIAPAQVNCRWAVDPLNAVTVPMVYQQFTSSANLGLVQPLSIPDTRHLANRSLYAQNLALDVDSNNNPVLFPSIAIRWLIGSGNPVPVSFVRALYDPTGMTPATGLVSSSDGAVLQFSYY